MLKNMLWSKSIKLSSIIAVLCTEAVLVGCGTKGPLYIPEQRYPQKAEQPASAPSNIQTQANKNKESP